MWSGLEITFPLLIFELMQLPLLRWLHPIVLLAKLQFFHALVESCRLLRVTTLSQKHHPPCYAQITNIAVIFHHNSYYSSFCSSVVLIFLLFRLPVFANSSWSTIKILIGVPSVPSSGLDINLPCSTTNFWSTIAPSYPFAWFQCHQFFRNQFISSKGNFPDWYVQIQLATLYIQHSTYCFPSLFFIKPRNLSSLINFS